MNRFEYWSRRFLSRIPTQTLDPANVAWRNLASIARVPLAVLPDGPARRFLMSEAAGGKDVYAYQALPHDSGLWNVWYGPLAPRYDARIDAHVWADHWRDLLREADGMAHDRQQAREAVRSGPRTGGDAR